MWHTTGWVLKTWLKTTLWIAAGVGAVWLLTEDRGYLTGAIILGVLAEIWTLRCLGREWLDDAHAWCWWWPR